MSHTPLLARAVSSYSSNQPKTAIAVGLACGVLMIGIGMIALICRTDRSTTHDPESAVARSQRLRREHDGRWGPTPARVETAAERRRRNIQARANRSLESGAQSEARRQSEVREQDVALPLYQLPAPVYFASPELRRQYLDRHGQTQLPPLVGDAPPAYDSAAVWPART